MKPNRKQRQPKIAQTSAPVTIQADGLYSAKQCASWAKVHPKTWWRWSRLGLVAPPVTFGVKTKRWTGQSILERKRTDAAA